MTSTAIDTFNVPGVELTPTGITFPKDISPDDHRRVGSALGRINGMTAWAIGDWFNANPAGMLESEITQQIGLTKGTVVEYARVASRFPPVRRRKVTWGVHQAVAALATDRQDALLDQAERENWSTAAMRLKVYGPPTPKLEAPPKPGTATVLPASSAPVLTVTVEWDSDVADDPDLVRTLNAEMRRMIEGWDFVKTVNIAPATQS